MKSAKPENPIMNWHLSAMRISPKTVGDLEQKFLFQRDQFANNTRCETTAYHGTYKGEQKGMTRVCWDEIITLLASDLIFEGDLEEELILPQYIFTFSNNGDDAAALRSIKKRKIEPCPVGTYKACDIHIKVTWDKTSDAVKEALDGLEMISFDRPVGEAGKFNRIYTLTFESLADGLTHFEHLKEHFSQTRGIEARLKLEIATCFYRQPDTAVVLPIVKAR